MRRKRPTKRQIVELFELHKGICWRCKQKIAHGVYGIDWELGHADKAHWLGGSELAPEHISCNREDGKLQTKLAAKSVRIRARSIGIKKPSDLAKRYAAVKERYKFDWRTRRWVPKP